MSTISVVLNLTNQDVPVGITPSGYLVTLLDSTGSVEIAQQSGTSENFTFEGIDPGTYIVSVVAVKEQNKYWSIPVKASVVVPEVPVPQSKVPTGISVTIS
jgi:hypothetical protein